MHVMLVHKYWTMGAKSFFFLKLYCQKLRKKKKGYTILVLIEVELDDFNHYFGQTHFHKWYFIKLGARPNDWIRNNWSRDLLYTWISKLNDFLSSISYFCFLSFSFLNKQKRQIMCVALFHMNLKHSKKKTFSYKKLELMWSRLREPPSSFFLFFELTVSKMSNYSAPREQCSLLFSLTWMVDPTMRGEHIAPGVLNNFSRRRGSISKPAELNPEKDCSYT